MADRHHEHSGQTARIRGRRIRPVHDARPVREPIAPDLARRRMEVSESDVPARSSDEGIRRRSRGREAMSMTNRIIATSVPTRKPSTPSRPFRATILLVTRYIGADAASISDSAGNDRRTIRESEDRVSPINQPGGNRRARQGRLAESSQEEDGDGGHRIGGRPVVGSLTRGRPRTGLRP